MQYKLVMKEDIETLEAEEPLKPERKREEKIRRARRDIELKKQIKLINEKLQELTKKEDEKLEDEIEEYYREVLILQIGSYLTKTIDELILIAEEVPLLEHMEQMKKTGNLNKKEEKPLPTTKPKIFTIPSRQQKISQVFRPHYTPYTMSIEEAGEIDYREMLERQKREEISKKDRENQPNEDDLDHYDIVQVYKERDNDLFKDENPTGWGNQYKRG